MNFEDIVLKRRMVRHFTAEPVDDEVVRRMLELARHAPSAGFTQGQSFVVVRDAGDAACATAWRADRRSLR